MKILVCGGRDYDDRTRLTLVLDEYLGRVTTIIEGEAAGADTLAREWAQGVGVEVDPYPAEWSRYGRAAGPIRNARMIDEGQPDLVIAFPTGDRGTANMIRQAIEAGIAVREIDG